MTDPHSFDRETIHKLLGGYATGTLTPEEQQALFEAALTDQELFDALAGEQSLRDLLRDPAARAQLLSAIDDRPLPWYRRFWRPMALAATAAACFLVGGIFVVREHRKPAPDAGLLAEVKQPQPAAIPAPPPSPPRQPPAVAEENRPQAAPRQLAMKKAPLIPPPTAAPGAAGELAKDAAPERKAETAVAQGQLSAPVAASPMAAPVAPVPIPAPHKPSTEIAMNDASAGSAGIQPFQEAGSKSIPLQNAQALFYAAPQSDIAAQSGRFFSPQQQSQGTQRDEKQQAQSNIALKSLARALRVPNLGVKWTLLRQRDGGEFVDAPPDQLQAGDSVKLKLLPNDDGFLSITQGAKVLKTVPVKRFTPVESPVITADGPGRQIVTVQLTRTVPQPGVVRNVVEQQSATDALDHSTYVMNTNTSVAAPIVVTIPLVFK